MYFRVSWSLKPALRAFQAHCGASGKGCASGTTAVVSTEALAAHAAVLSPLRLGERSRLQFLSSEYAQELYMDNFGS